MLSHANIYSPLYFGLFINHRVSISLPCRNKSENFLNLNTCPKNHGFKYSLPSKRINICTWFVMINIGLSKTVKSFFFRKKIPCPSIYACKLNNAAKYHMHFNEVYYFCPQKPTRKSLQFVSCKASQSHMISNPQHTV